MKVQDSFRYGTTFEFVKEPLCNISHVQKFIACPVGRQVAIRNLNNNNVTMIKKQHDAD